MKKIFYTTFALLMISCNQNPYSDMDNVASDYNIIPKPVKVDIQKGRFLLNNKTVIHAPEALGKEADFLREYIALQTGIQVNVSNQPFTQQAQGIILNLDTAIAEKEGYKLSVTPSQVIVSGQNAEGVFWGIQTLRQLIVKTNNDFTILDTEIQDAPRYAYRGIHLDVARHFFPVDFVKKYIDLLALHKINKFHWHLTDDQGWRIEIKKYPKLTEVGAWRAETAIKKHFPGSGMPDETFVGDGKRYGGFYTQEQAREIVDYAAQRHITVIPEIDMPGHMVAALACFPELGNGTGPYEVMKWWGVSDQILAPKEETFTFLENVLTEIMEIFPSEYIHIGGDEAPKKEWKNSQQAQQLIKKLGLKDDTQPNPIDGKKHTKEEKLQSYFINRIEQFVNSKGRQIIGWDEILEGGLAPNATVMSWRGVEGGLAAARSGHKAIMTPGDFCYFDHYQDKEDQEKKEPFAICCLTTVEEAYSYNPTPEQLSAKERDYIWGVQANLWTEYIATPEHAEYMIAPRICALSEVAWTPNEAKNYDDFLTRLNTFRSILDAMNINYAKHVFESK